MFSIAKFIFSVPPGNISEGGNTRALVRDPETGESRGDSAVRTFRGRRGYAEKIDLRSGRITRQQLRTDIIDMLRVLDREYEKDHGRPIWDPSQRDDILGSGFAFNGSSAHLFAPPEVLSDEEFVEFKPTVGDVDLTVPEDTRAGLYQALNRREDMQLTPKIAYVGHNKKTLASVRDQINALFAYTWDPKAPEGEGDIFFQIDFEFTDYEGGRPTEWTKFSRSSAWRDVVERVKGLAHKYLIFSLASVRSYTPRGSRLATDAATAEKPRVSMTQDTSKLPLAPEEFEALVQKRYDEIMRAGKAKDPEKAMKAARDQVSKETKVMKPVYAGSTVSVDLPTGMGTRLEKLGWLYDGQEVYRRIKTASRKNTKDIREIFKYLMNSDSPPTPKDLEDFGSFVGTLDMMRGRLSPQDNVRVYESMLFKLFGERGQPISATDPNEDRAVKERIVEVFRQRVPDVEASTVDLESMKREYYSKYKVRGQEGFVEDDEASDINESRGSRLTRLIKAVIWGH